MKIYNVGFEYDEYFLNEKVAKKYAEANSLPYEDCVPYVIEVHTENEFREIDVIDITIKNKINEKQEKWNDGCINIYYGLNNIDFKSKDQIKYKEYEGYYCLEVRLKYNNTVSKDKYITFAKEVLSDINKFKKNKDAFDDLDKWIDYRWNNRGYYFTFS